MLAVRCVGQHNSYAGLIKFLVFNSSIHEGMLSQTVDNPNPESMNQSFSVVNMTWASQPLLKTDAMQQLGSDPPTYNAAPLQG